MCGGSICTPELSFSGREGSCDGNMFRSFASRTVYNNPLVIIGKCQYPLACMHSTFSTTTGDAPPIDRPHFIFKILGTVNRDAVSIHYTMNSNINEKRRRRRRWHEIFF